MKSIETKIIKAAAVMQRCVHLLKTVAKGQFWSQTTKHEKLREFLHELAKQLVELTAPQSAPLQVERVKNTFAVSSSDSGLVVNNCGTGQGNEAE